MSTTHTPEPWPKLNMPYKPGHTAAATISAADYNYAVDRVNALAGISDPVAALQKVREALNHFLFAEHTLSYKLQQEALALLTPNK